jgi:hypothetical protein
MSHTELVTLCKAFWQKLERLETQIKTLQSKRNPRKTGVVTGGVVAYGDEFELDPRLSNYLHSRAVLAAREELT